MIGKIFKLLPEALSSLFKDKVNFILMITPVIIGLVIYGFGISVAYDFFKGSIDGVLRNHLNSENVGIFLSNLFAGILTILAIFLANWIFVLLTALIASPFNDIISSRIAKKIKGQQQGNLEQATESMFKRMFKTFVNEAKKIIIIAAVSTIAVVFGYIPPLIPVSIIIAFILISIQFVDYSWSRDGLATGACFRDVLGNIFFYIPAGAIFFLMINIPLMNLFVPAIATSYYTNYWEKRKLN